MLSGLCAIKQIVELLPCRLRRQNTTERKLNKQDSKGELSRLGGKRREENISDGDRHSFFLYVRLVQYNEGQKQKITLQPAGWCTEANTSFTVYQQVSSDSQVVLMLLIIHCPNQGNGSNVQSFQCCALLRGLMTYCHLVASKSSQWLTHDNLLSSYSGCSLDE